MQDRAHIADTALGIQQLLERADAAEVRLDEGKSSRRPTVAPLQADEMMRVPLPHATSEAPPNALALGTCWPCDATFEEGEVSVLRL